MKKRVIHSLITLGCLAGVMVLHGAGAEPSGTMFFGAALVLELVFWKRLLLPRNRV